MFLMHLVPVISILADYLDVMADNLVVYRAVIYAQDY